MSDDLDDFDIEAGFDPGADFDTAFDIETTKMTFIYVPPSRLEGEPTVYQDTPWPASPLLEEPVGLEQAYEWPRGSEWPLDAEWPQESELPQDLQLPQDLDIEPVKLSQASQKTPESRPTQESESRPTQEFEPTLPQARPTRQCLDCNTLYSTEIRYARCEACRLKRRPTVLRLRKLMIDGKYEKMIQ